MTDVGVDDKVLLIAKQQGLALLLHLAGGPEANHCTRDMYYLY